MIMKIYEEYDNEDSDEDDGVDKGEHLRSLRLYLYVLVHGIIALF
jgi:hypothetical protein